MQHGRLVECGSADQVWRAPAHPYTQSLLQAVPHAPGADQAVTVVQ
jgi:peptide/nickel transport system ATP-binding protein